jgi:hypothetical protein
MPLGLDIGESINNFFDVLFAWLPRVVGAIAVLLLAWLIAKLLGALTRRVLIWLGLDRLAQSRHGQLIQKVTASPSALFGAIVFWVVILGGIAVAADVLGVQSVKDLVASIYGYVPNILAALVILVVAGLLASWVGALIGRIMAGNPMTRLISTVAQVLILAVAVFMALDQLNIAGNIVVITYASVMGAVALGMAVAFGLGGRELAGEALRGAYSRGRVAASAPPSPPPAGNPPPAS